MIFHNELWKAHDNHLEKHINIRIKINIYLSDTLASFIFESFTLKNVVRYHLSSKPCFDTLAFVYRLYKGCLLVADYIFFLPLLKSESFCSVFCCQCSVGPCVVFDLLPRVFSLFLSSSYEFQVSIWLFLFYFECLKEAENFKGSFFSEFIWKALNGFDFLWKYYRTMRYWKCNIFNMYYKMGC